MKNKRFTTIAIALAAISASSSTEAFAGSKPFMARNRSGFAICRNIGAAPKLTVCVSGKPGSGRVSDAAIKSAALSIKKMALVYGAKYSVLSNNQISKFDVIAPGDEPAPEDVISTDSTPVVSSTDDSSTEEALPSIFDQPSEEVVTAEEAPVTTEEPVVSDDTVAAAAEAAITASDSSSSTVVEPSSDLAPAPAADTSCGSTLSTDASVDLGTSVDDGTGSDGTTAGGGNEGTSVDDGTGSGFMYYGSMYF